MKIFFFDEDMNMKIEEQSTSNSIDPTMTNVQRDVDAVNEYVVRDVIDTLRREMQADEINTAPLDELKRLWRLKIPALAAADLAEDQDTAALMENPFLADLGAIMQMGVGIKAEDALNDDAAFALLMQSVVDNDASTAETANSTADTAAAATAAVTSSSGAFSSLGLPAVRLKPEPTDNEPVVPQIDGGTGVNPVASGGTGGSSASTATVSSTAPADQPPLTGADRETVGSDDDDSEINAAVGGTQADIRDFVVCLYEGVKRTKTRTKLSLADGVASVQGVDYVFRKAAGEIDFADGAGGASAPKARRGRGKN